MASAARTRSASGMGITNVDAKVSRPDKTGSTVPVTLMVDSGAVCSVLPAAVWRPLDLVGDREAITPHRTTTTPIAPIV